ncbi:MAG: hypothetical protein ACK2US_13400 [Anaerolineae bacterium]|jgi:hypothetical protein
MKLSSRKQSVVWGSLLVLFGVLAMIEQFVDLSPWVWVGVLAVSGLGVFAIYLTERSAWGLLLTAYILWAVAGVIVFAELEILPDSFIALYVLTAVALPFLVVFLRDRSQWWALIPAYVLIAIGVIISLSEWNVMGDDLVAPFILAIIALPFLVVFLHNRRNWWALIPAYVLLVIGVMVALIELQVLSDLLIPAYVLLTIALPFFVVFARNPKHWWALIPGGILALIGLSFLLATAAVQVVGAAALIIAGVVILVLQLVRKK